MIVVNIGFEFFILVVDQYSKLYFASSEDVKGLRQDWDDLQNRESSIDEIGFIYCNLFLQ